MLRRTKPNEDLQKIFDSVFKRNFDQQQKGGHPTAYDKLKGVKEVESDDEYQPSPVTLSAK